MAADKTSVNITYYDQRGNKGMKAITDINPNASNAEIKDFANGLNALTTNTVASLEKIERTNITAATGKPKVTLAIQPELDEFKGSFTEQVSDTAAKSTVQTTITTALTMIGTNGDKLSVNDHAYIAMAYVPEGASETKLKFVADMTKTTGTPVAQAIMDIVFAETDTTAETTYRLTVIRGDTPQLTQVTLEQL